MENPSDTTESSSEIRAWRNYQPPVDRDTIVMLSPPTSSESEGVRSSPPKDKEVETRVSDKEGGSTSNVVGGGGDKEETVAAANERVLPQCEVDGSEKKEKVSDEIPFKGIIEALVRNSVKKVEEEGKGQKQSYVEMLTSMGFKFP